MPKRRSTAFGPKARRTWGFQAHKRRRETVWKKKLAEGRRAVGGDHDLPPASRPECHGHTNGQRPPVGAEGIDMFKNRMRCLPEAADGLKASAQDGLAWLDKQMEGKNFICGDRITIADLVLYCCTKFSAGVGQTIGPSLENVNAWSNRIDQRPSAEASLHPAAETVGMKG